LRDLSERTQETVHLVFSTGMKIVYLDKLKMPSYPSGLRMASNVGLRNPAIVVRLGKVCCPTSPGGIAST